MLFYFVHTNYEVIFHFSTAAITHVLLAAFVVNSVVLLRIHFRIKQWSQDDYILRMLGRYQFNLEE